MPESVSGVDEILARLRGRCDAGRVWSGPVVPLSDAVAAVHAAADARTQEIVKALRDKADEQDRPGEAFLDAITYRVAADFLARRFPNGGTPA